MDSALRQFRFLFTTRPKGMPSGLPIRRIKTVCGLNQLDATVRLGQLMHKQNLSVHAVLNCAAIAKGQRPTEIKL